MRSTILRQWDFCREEILEFLQACRTIKYSIFQIGTQIWIWRTTAIPDLEVVWL